MSVVPFPLTVARSRTTSPRRATARSVALAASAWVLFTGPAVMPAHAAPPGDYRVKGVDTSHYNHPGSKAIDWRQVRRAGYAFMYAKATEGTTHQDDWLAADLKGAEAAGLVRGAYHFYGTTPGKDQARNFVATVKEAGYTGKAPGELPPAIDLELGSGGTCPNNFSTAGLRAFLRTLDAEMKVAPVVYTTAQFVDTCMGGDGALFTDHMLWQPRYRSGIEPEAVPGAGSRWKIWQHSEQGNVPGIESKGRTDLNVFRGTLAELKRRAHLPAG
ncbi:glycoside hydrolase family 25 protein [Streptomyces sp. NPDC005494]|uniref:glycoside hydrolase family 25 protein n=1 Tax=Streptomyces sp. NPDC005494 TaxID=3364715 RepID=UPI0036962473